MKDTTIEKTIDAYSSSKASSTSLLKSTLHRRQQQAMTLPEKLPPDMIHSGSNPSIHIESPRQNNTPWTPTSLGRAKSAIVYKQTLNDSLMVLETWSYFFHDWKYYFVSLQADCLLLFNSREDWEQGNEPHKVIRLNHLMMLSDMVVQVQSDDEDDEQYRMTHDFYDTDTDNQAYYSTRRLFRRKLLEADEFDDWINKEMHENLHINNAGSNSDHSIANNPSASARCVLEFGVYDLRTFELWSKAIRKTLALKKKEHQQAVDSHRQRRNEIHNSSTSSGKAFKEKAEPNQSDWITPGKDCKISLMQSELWCSRVLADDWQKAESELRRLSAMESLISQITSDEVALMVYQKVSRVHELFVANAKRERDHGHLSELYQPKLSPEILDFFSDHLQRKYAVFLSLSLASNLLEEEIREAHELMCKENHLPKQKASETSAASNNNNNEGESSHSSDAYGFDTPECLELYKKYRIAAFNYYNFNYGDAQSAEEEDAIMHLPVTLHIALLQDHQEEAELIYQILQNVKQRLQTVVDHQQQLLAQDHTQDEILAQDHSTRS